ncbi:MAG: HNH endonuclease [Methanosarcinales archaeon]
MKYVCRFGHTHRSEKAREYCHAERDWRQKDKQVRYIPWDYNGSTEIWLESKKFRHWFGSRIARAILRRDKFQCQYEGCELPYNLTVHHIVPRSLRGSDHPKNLISLCDKHHALQPAHYHHAGRLVLCEEDLLQAKEDTRDRTRRVLKEYRRQDE